MIKFLNEANEWHTNIKLDYQIGQSLPFLDVLLLFIINQLLNHMLYHLFLIIPNMYSVILYKLLLHELFDTHQHLKCLIMNVVRSNLCYYIMAKCLFLPNIRQMKVNFIHKIFFSYSSSFIEQQFRKFFNEYISSSSSFVPFINNKKTIFSYATTNNGSANISTITSHRKCTYSEY